jgi:alpha-L-fucosidase 2
MLPAWAEQRRDVEFARPGGETLLLDASIPDGPGPHPAVVLVHGGGWEAGDKQRYIHFVFEPLSKAGFAWFSVNYRLAPRHRFPACADDVRTAVEWVHRHAREYRVDPRRMALLGESAGGHLAAYVATQLKPATPVHAVVAFYGVHDFVSRAVTLGRVDKNVQQLLGVERLTADTAPVFRAASPVTHVRRGLPPFLMIHGTQDRGVPFAQSEEMCAKLKTLDVVCEVYPVEGGHGMDHWEPDPQTHHYKAKLVAWLRETLR